MMTPDEYRAARLRLWRGQATAASALGISVATLSDRERGRASIDPEAILALQAHELQRCLPDLLAEAADLLDRLGVSHGDRLEQRATALATLLRDARELVAAVGGRNRDGTGQEEDAAP